LDGSGFLTRVTGLFDCLGFIAKPVYYLRE
jgi:hypothetical protein